LFTVT